MLKFFSSGGVGDVLLVCNKLSKLHEGSNEKIYLKIFEKHSCHRNAITDVISGFPFIVGSVEVVDDAFRIANEEAKKVNAIYVGTKAVDSIFPISRIMKPINNNRVAPIKEKYICIGYAAGRMADNSKRIVHPKVFASLKAFFPQHHLVLIGPRFVEFGENVLDDKYNKTGRTQSLLDAFEYINGAEGFIGQDGVLSYYALMIGKPTIINWHDASLPGHYWNPEWKDHGISIFQDNALRWLTELELRAFDSMIRNK